ncbi:hypothetical protein MKW98_001383, partial [Papaver atlanticum]
AMMKFNYIVQKVLETSDDQIPGLNTCCVYGGFPYGPQETALSRRVDIFIGNYGKIKDHVERGNLDFHISCIFARRVGFYA